MENKRHQDIFRYAVLTTRFIDEDTQFVQSNPQIKEMPGGNSRRLGRSSKPPIASYHGLTRCAIVRLRRSVGNF